MLIRRFREDVTRAHHRIDYAGAITLAIGGSLLILGLLEGGVEWACVILRVCGGPLVATAAKTTDKLSPH